MVYYFLKEFNKEPMTELMMALILIRLIKEMKCIDRCPITKEVTIRQIT